MANKFEFEFELGAWYTENIFFKTSGNYSLNFDSDTVALVD